MPACDDWDASLACAWCCGCCQAACRGAVGSNASRFGNLAAASEGWAVYAVERKTLGSRQQQWEAGGPKSVPRPGKLIACLADHMNQLLLHFFGGLWLLFCLPLFLRWSLAPGSKTDTGQGTRHTVSSLSFAQCASVVPSWTICEIIIYRLRSVALIAAAGFITFPAAGIIVLHRHGPVLPPRFDVPPPRSCPDTSLSRGRWRRARRQRQGAAVSTA